MTADDEQPTNEVELPGRPVASAAGAEDTMVDVPREAPPRDESATAPLGRRPQPDVLFAPGPAAYQVPPPYQGGQPAFGPDDATGPQGPPAAHGHGAFPPAVAPQGPPPKKRGPVPLIALVSVLGLVAIAAAAFLLWPGTDQKTVAQNATASPRAVTTSPTTSPTASASASARAPQPGTTPSASAPTPGSTTSPLNTAVPQAQAPAPQPNQTGAPVSGTTTSGVGVSYQTVEVAPGYFEGTLTFTNNTGRPMPSWTVSFNYPGSNITNVWGGVLVKSGSQVTIRSDATSAPVPVGSSVSVRFGGSGTASKPTTCLLAGQPCGF